MVLSAPRLKRKRVIKVSLDATKGATDTVPSQAILVYDLDIQPTAPFAQRRGTGLYRGQMNPGVVEEMSGTWTFTAELLGTGAGGLELGLAILLQACGFKQTLEVYSVHSGVADDKTISMAGWVDGKKKSLTGASGTVKFSTQPGKRMLLNFEFSGIWQDPIDEALPAYAPSAALPIFAKGGTFTLGGESIKFTDFELDMGCAVVMRGDPDAATGIGYYHLVDYETKLNMTVESDLVAGYDFYGIWKAGTPAEVSYALTDGTDIFTFALPAVQYSQIAGVDVDGVEGERLTAEVLHSTGDDSVALTVTAPV